MRLFYQLIFFICIHMLNSEEVTSVKNELMNKTTDANNHTFQFERITKPLDQSHVERALASSLTNSSAGKGNTEFRPSPPLETYVEFNKFPVPPALPEAKHFSSLNFGESPIQWPEKHFTTEQSWTSMIKFPTTSTTTPKAHDRPYPFYNTDSFTGKSIKTDNYVYKPYEKSSSDEWNKYMDYEKKKIVERNKFDFTAPVARPDYGTSSQKSGFDFGITEKPHEVQGSPWKKIVKFLTTFIPIGLLISALTPTVITVQSVNGTQTRSRAVNSNNKLISSLNYLNSIGCEDRILCELVLSASSTQNGEQHVENLLNTFTKEGKAVEKAEEMRKVLEAVKRQDCGAILCKSIKDKT